MAAIERSRTGTDAPHFLTALCIPQIGLDAAKRLVGAYGWPGFTDALAARTSFAEVDGIGPERSGAVYDWYDDPDNRKTFDELLGLLQIPSVEPAGEAAGTCAGMTFVITGDVHQFKNRDAFKAYVEANGGKVAGSVSKKTDFLVNNDAASASSKNKKAAELGIPVITEDEFVSRFGK